MRPTRNSSLWTTQPITSSAPVQILKSTFQGHAAELPDNWSRETARERVSALLDYLVDTVPRAKWASHAMWAWRGYVRSDSSSAAAATRPTMETGASDGGEVGAGEHLARLLERSQSENVIVVVHRWYGGVPLGTQRWKCISEVAKAALSDGAFSPSLRFSKSTKR